MHLGPPKVPSQRLKWLKMTIIEKHRKQLQKHYMVSGSPCPLISFLDVSYSVNFVVGDNDRYLGGSKGLKSMGGPPKQLRGSQIQLRT